MKTGMVKRPPRTWRAYEAVELVAVAAAFPVAARRTAALVVVHATGTVSRYEVPYPQGKPLRSHVQAVRMCRRLAPFATPQGVSNGAEVGRVGCAGERGRRAR